MLTREYFEEHPQVETNNGATYQGVLFDLHFKSVTDMNNTGTGADLSGTFTTDIDGTTRGVWTRGADYVPSERFVSPGAGQFCTVGGNIFVVA